MLDNHGCPLGDDLLGLVELLRWQGDAPIFTDLRDSFDALLENLFASPAFADAVGASTVSGVSQLSDRARLEFLRAPQVVAQIVRWRRHRMGLDAGFFAEMVLAELAHAGLVQDLPVAVWRARGDTKISWSKGSKNVETTPWLLDGEIAIDDKSFQMFPYDGNEQKLLLPLNDPGSQKVRRMLAGSFYTLADVSSPAAEFVRMFLRQISIRFEPGAPTAFNTSSFSQYIGLALLVNPHIDDVDKMNLIEGLVHESIHSMLYMLEAVTGPSVLVSPQKMPMIQSPWTGMTLNLSSFVHACVVWYGVFWLWNNLMNAKAFPQHRCQLFRERALTGFKRAPLAEFLAHRSVVSKPVLELLEAISATDWGERISLGRV